VGNIGDTLGSKNIENMEKAKKLEERKKTKAEKGDLSGGRRNIAESGEIEDVGDERRDGKAKGERLLPSACENAVAGGIALSA